MGAVPSDIIYRDDFYPEVHCFAGHLTYGIPCRKEILLDVVLQYSGEYAVEVHRAIKGHGPIYILVLGFIAIGTGYVDCVLCDVFDGIGCTIIGKIIANLRGGSYPDSGFVIGRVGNFFPEWI